ncbi:MAG: hypothetical protein RL172_1771 [Bacteroidota bacterium]|jgi:hypothetical protein
MSRLEKYIKDNRDLFDEALPSTQVWDTIEKKINAPQTNPFTISHKAAWLAAASVLLLLLLTVWFNKSNHDLPTTDTAADIVKDSSAMPDIATVNPDALPEVNQFAQLIALKQQELKQLSHDQPALYQKFTSDIQRLDSTYTILKKHLQMAPNKELLLQAMVQNLQLQLEVLNQQLQVIQTIKQSNNNSHEKTNNYQ